MVESIIRHWFFLSPTRSAKMCSPTPARAQRIRPRQIMPLGAGSQHPQHAVDELLVVYRSPAEMPRSTWKRALIRSHCPLLNSYRLATLQVQQMQTPLQSL